MLRSIRSLIFTAPAFFTLLLMSASVFADAPQWLKQASAVTPPAYEKDVPAVVLLQDQQVTLGGDGKLVTTDRFAVKILTRDGRNMAFASAYYLVSSGKVRDISAWMIRPDGTVKEYGDKSVFDQIADPDDVYNEQRLKFIDGSDDVNVGYIFGYSVVSEDLPLFYQDSWIFQMGLPTLVSRYSLTVPSGWTASSITFNAPEIKPQNNGSTYVWELRNLAPIPREPMSPSIRNLAPRISVNYAPPSVDKAVNRAFADWKDVSRWGAAMHEPYVVVDDAVAVKARELTANATSELEKIRLIGAYVQNLQYISIDIGVGHGNGFRPRSSTLVLGRGYGDCKDKANLMRAMLRSLKIEAYPVAIYSGDASYVRAEWASPGQFNHCIIAVKVSNTTVSPTIIEHEKLGRLLIFDATDPYTPVGDLPDYLQGSLALIMAGDDGGLSRMPVTPIETDRLERTIEVDLNSIGELKGVIRERAYGQSSTLSRREFRESSLADFRKMIEGWLTRGATGAKLENLQTKDGQATATFETDVNFSVARYGQVMQDRLLVFKPVIVGRRNSIYLTEKTRTNPIEFESSLMKETAIFTLPDGFVVDEMPDGANLDTPFGTYSTKYEVKANKLVFTRQMAMKRSLVPADKYAGARDFFSKIREAEQSPVVLIRK